MRVEALHIIWEVPRRRHNLVDVSGLRNLVGQEVDVRGVDLRAYSKRCTFNTCCRAEPPVGARVSRRLPKKDLTTPRSSAVAAWRGAGMSLR